MSQHVAKTESQFMDAYLREIKLIVDFLAAIGALVSLRD